MSQFEHFDGLLELFNSSAKLIHDQQASRQVNDHAEFGARYQPTAFSLSLAPENVRKYKQVHVRSYGEDSVNVYQTNETMEPNDH